MSAYLISRFGNRAAYRIVAISLTLYLALMVALPLFAPVEIVLFAGGASFGAAVILIIKRMRVSMGKKKIGMLNKTFTA